MLTLSSRRTTRRDHRSVEPPRPLVLVVDDNADITAAIALAVQVLGYRAETVSTGDVALPVIVEHEPTHVLIDLCMPGMNGWDLARRVRARALANPPRLVAITGLRDPVVRMRSVAAGFDDHLVKPIGLDDLRRVLGEAPAR